MRPDGLFAPSHHRFSPIDQVFFRWDIPVFGLFLSPISERPNQIEVAIPRNVRIPESQDWPAMKFYRMMEPRYSISIVDLKEGSNSFRIYDKEKAVCDVIYHRNKIRFELAMEVLKRYVQQPDRNIKSSLR